MMAQFQVKHFFSPFKNMFTQYGQFIKKTNAVIKTD